MVIKSSPRPANPSGFGFPESTASLHHVRLTCPDSAYRKSVNSSNYQADLFRFDPNRQSTNSSSCVQPTVRDKPSLSFLMSWERQLREHPRRPLQPALPGWTSAPGGARKNVRPQLDFLSKQKHPGNVQTSTMWGGIHFPQSVWPPLPFLRQQYHRCLGIFPTSISWRGIHLSRSASAASGGTHGILRQAPVAGWSDKITPANVEKKDKIRRKSANETRQDLWSSDSTSVADNTSGGRFPDHSWDHGTPSGIYHLGDSSFSKVPWKPLVVGSSPVWLAYWRVSVIHLLFLSWSQNSCGEVLCWADFLGQPLTFDKKFVPIECLHSASGCFDKVKWLNVGKWEMCLSGIVVMWFNLKKGKSWSVERKSVFFFLPKNLRDREDVIKSVLCWWWYKGCSLGG